MIKATDKGPPQSVVKDHRSGVTRHRSWVKSQWSRVSGHSSEVRVTDQTSRVTGQGSLVRGHWSESRVTGQWSKVTGQSSRVTGKTIFYLQTLYESDPTEGLELMIF